MNITLPWARFKTIESATYYIDANGNYYLLKTQSPIEYQCVIDKESEDAHQFDSDYKSQATMLVK